MTRYTVKRPAGIWNARANGLRIVPHLLRRLRWSRHAAPSHLPSPTASRSRGVRRARRVGALSRFWYVPLAPYSHAAGPECVATIVCVGSSSLVAISLDDVVLWLCEGAYVSRGREVLEDVWHVACGLSLFQRAFAARAACRFQCFVEWQVPPDGRRTLLAAGRMSSTAPPAGRVAAEETCCALPSHPGMAGIQPRPYPPDWTTDPSPTSGAI